MSLFKKIMSQQKDSNFNKILVVDDEIDLCQLLEVALGHSGFEARSVYDGFSALKTLEKYPADLIILDIHMPKMSGQQVLAELLKNPETARIPVIIITSLSADEKIADEEWAARMEVAGFISKPFEPAQLVDKVHEILNQKKS